MKTKPTQQAIRLLREEGILPDFIVCRSKEPLDSVRKKKIEEFANIASDCVISAPDIQTIYQMPLDLEREKLGDKLLSRLHLVPRMQADWSDWSKRVRAIVSSTDKITIAIVGKYFALGDYNVTDSYVSIYQALLHAGAEISTKIDIQWIDSQAFEDDPKKLRDLDRYDGVIIPGGFGSAGVEGKIMAIEYVRTHDIPYLGLCYGMQLAAVEFARNVCKLKGAHTTEIDPKTAYPIIDILPWQKKLLEQREYGASMRLGAYDAYLKPGTKVAQAYDRSGSFTHKGYVVAERHRHRYEVNPAYVKVLEDNGIVFSGYHVRQDGTKLMEFMELPDHPFFVATQAHPEFTSRLDSPNPLFFAFVCACKQGKQLVTDRA